MTSLDAAHHPDAGIERGHAAEHVHGFHVQPSITPRVAPRQPVWTPELSRIDPRARCNPFPGDVSVVITNTGDTIVSDVHVSDRPVGALELVGNGAGEYHVPENGSICVSWLGHERRPGNGRSSRPIRARSKESDGN